MMDPHGFRASIELVALRNLLIESMMMKSNFFSEFLAKFW